MTLVCAQTHVTNDRCVFVFHQQSILPAAMHGHEVTVQQQFRPSAYGRLPSADRGFQLSRHQPL